MTDPGDDAQRNEGRRAGGTRAGGAPGDWEQRAAGLASEIQRWLIRTSARNMRDELGGQVKKALRGAPREQGDSWATATTEPPHAADEAPECAWCPVCRAARRISRAREGSDNRGGPRISDAADVMAAAVKEALSGIDSILSYRPTGTGSAAGSAAGPAAGSAAEPTDRQAGDQSAGPTDREAGDQSADD
jgi:hypothetical protein